MLEKSRLFYHERGLDVVANLVSFVEILQVREQELRLALFLRRMAGKGIAGVNFGIIRYNDRSNQA